MISIIMSVRNEEGFLAECLQSIVDQTEKNWELLAVDDHSEDQSLEILSTFAIRDSRIRIFSNQGNGIIPALRLAFSKAGGQWITRMDADDIMPATKLHSLKSKLESLNPGYIATGNVRYFSHIELQEGFLKYADWLNELNKNRSHYQQIYKECVVASPAWMARTDDLKAIHAFEKAVYPEDYDLVFRWYQHGFKISPVEELVHYWRDHSARASRNDPNYRDNLFARLKCKYFKMIDYDPSKQLILWGAGKKAKRIAKELLVHKMKFRWLTDNEKKIGKHIYGISIESIERIPAAHRQVIVAISDTGFKSHKPTLYQRYFLDQNEIFEFT